MITVERVVHADITDVWAVLADGWLYPLWVTGASRMREVDQDWPEVGARLHHSVGSWPVLIDDTTSATRCEPGRRLSLQARAWPTGEATVDLQLEPDPGGTKVTMTEDASRGPGRLVPGVVRKPLLRWRNEESLERLALVVENRQRA
jgi:uncharacterized protein YndB with AHSA1/START domain